MAALGYVSLYVHDVGSTVAFYQAAFGLTLRFAHEGGDWAELETGTTRLSFAARSLIDTSEVRSTEPSDCFSITLVSEDVTTLFDQAITEGAVPVSEPATKPWGQTTAYVRDPNGFLVEIATPVG